MRLQQTHLHQLRSQPRPLQPPNLARAVDFQDELDHVRLESNVAQTDSGCGELQLAEAQNEGQLAKIQGSLVSNEGPKNKLGLPAAHHEVEVELEHRSPG